MAKTHETPATVLIDQHYRELGLDKPWNNERVNKLCQMLQITPWELGRLFLIDSGSMKRFIQNDRFPPYVALHFALLESWYVTEAFGIPQKPIIPIQHLV